MSNYKLVYSTEKPIKKDSQLQKNIATKKEQAVRIHLDRKGGGKIQTIVRGLILDKENLKILAKDIKVKCATGGSVKENEIIIQGNKREEIKNFLESKGYKPKLSGG
tara:strand:- start:143 stop:463 length:321 start_codon:yes stop_codon:yes gene_type:complete